MYRNCQKKFFKYFVSDRTLLYKYTFLSFIVGILELFGVALTYPFINKLITDGGKNSLWFGGLIVLAFLGKNLVMILYNSLQVKFTKNCESEIIKKFMQYFLCGDYKTVHKIRFAQKQQIMSYLIPNTVNNFLIRILNLYVNLFIFVLITAFLFIKFFTATIVTVVCSIILLSAQYKFFKSKTKNLASEINKAGESTNSTYNETLLNLKNVKILGGEKLFYEKFCNQVERLKDISGKLLFYNLIPPYVTEPCIILLLLILLIIVSAENMSDTASLVASYAVIVTAIFRLAPTISRIQVNLTNLQTTLPLAKQLVEYYEKYDITNITLAEKTNKIEMQESLEFKNICFSYDTQPVLKNISFCIKKGEFVGIAGVSGGGKTTLADIISGLLIPQSGEILVDGTPVNKLNLKIGYIPQEYSIISASIRENIAFGDEHIDDEKVIDSLKKAQIYDFISSRFEEGIYANPFVDNSGFSQGQKQRLAIARALYLDPDILILDEATSSLDLKTEDEICNVLNSLKGEKTIIAIAHRLSTIKSADKIIFMKEAQIEDIENFNELISHNKDFQELIKLNNSQPV